MSGIAIGYSGVRPSEKVAKASDSSTQLIKDTTNASMVSENITPIKDGVTIPKASKSAVQHSVQIVQESSIAEGVVNTTKTTLGNAQSIVDGAKRVVTLGEEATGILAKASNFIEASRTFKNIDKVVNHPLTNKVLGTASVVSGGIDIYKGVKQIKKGETEKGVFTVASGTSSMVMGGALLTGATGLATTAGFVGIGIAIVKTGNDAVKELGWFKDKNGNNQSSFTHFYAKANDWGNNVEKSTNSKLLGYTAKAGGYVIGTVAATATSVAGFGVKTYNTVSHGVSIAGDYMAKTGKSVSNWAGDTFHKIF